MHDCASPCLPASLATTKEQKISRFLHVEASLKGNWNATKEGRGAVVDKGGGGVLSPYSFVDMQELDRSYQHGPYRPDGITVSVVGKKKKDEKKKRKN